MEDKEELKNKSIPLVERIEKLENKETKVKKRKFRLPRRGKVGRSKIKKGYTTVMRIDDNGNIDFEKQKIQDSTYRLSTKDYHVTDKKDILSYKGKPFIIQPAKKLNPYNPLDGKNETYGQPYIMARMLGDTIKVKSKNAKGLIWVLVAGVVLYVGYMLLTGGF